MPGKSSRAARARYRGALLAPFALLLAGAARPPAPQGELLLDAADPVVAVEIEGVALRLRVDLNYRDSVELNPDAAARLPVQWEQGDGLQIGRIRLPERLAKARLQRPTCSAAPPPRDKRLCGKAEGARRIDVQIAEHSRACCAGADGGIGPQLLDYATIRWVRHDAPAPTDTVVLPLDLADQTGLSAPAGAQAPGVALSFDLSAPQSLATATAAARLARAWGGHWAGPGARRPLAFAVERPVRPIAFDRPSLLAGFRFDRLDVRSADFGGSAGLPTDPIEPGAILVRGRAARQPDWPVVILGQDRLGRCAEIVYSSAPRTLTLRCAFDRPR